MDEPKVKSFVYKNFVIQPQPWKMAGNKGWIPHATLSVDRHGEVKMLPLSWQQIFPTQEEASHYSVGMTVQYIDQGKADSLLIKEKGAEILPTKFRCPNCGAEEVHVTIDRKAHSFSFICLSCGKVNKTMPVYEKGYTPTDEYIQREIDRVRVK